MNIAIFGGSFNPPHLGHLASARGVMEELTPDLLLIIPASIPPHKAMEEGSPDPQARMKLCRLCFGEIEKAQISDIELRREGKSYTADTLQELMEIYPGAKFTFVLGTDMLLTFEEWYRYTFLLQNMRLAVLARCEFVFSELRRVG